MGNNIFFGAMIFCFVDKKNYNAINTLPVFGAFFSNKKNTFETNKASLCSF